MKGKDILSVWDEASIHEIFHQTGLVDNNLPYKVKFENFVNGKLRSTFYKRLGLKHIAYFKPATIRLQVGTRVIGKYFFTYLQGHRSQIDTFQTNSFSWITNGIVSKRKICWKFRPDQSILVESTSLDVQKPFSFVYCHKAGFIRYAKTQIARTWKYLNVLYISNFPISWLQKPLHFDQNSIIKLSEMYQIVSNHSINWNELKFIGKYWMIIVFLSTFSGVYWSF